MGRVVRLAAAGLAGAVCLWGAPGFGYSADEDFEFASGLIQFEPSFRDYAQKVVDGILARDPTQGDRAKVIQAELFVKNRQYDKAEELVREMGVTNPKAQAIMLSLAVGYYNSGEQDKAVQLYEDFFKMYQGKTPDDPDVARFYEGAAFQYAQIKEAMDDYAGAADCYRRVGESSAAKSKAMQREMQLKEAESWLKAAERQGGDDRKGSLEKVNKICETIMWGGLDVTFVKAIVVMANAEIVAGHPDKAREVLNEYMVNIKQVDDIMKEQDMAVSESPMGGARSLLGRLLKDEAEALERGGDRDGALAKYAEALSEYYNVFVKYGKGPYGPAAGMEAKAIKEILETRYGKTVKIDLPSNLAAKAAGTEFMMADNLFRKKDYAAAQAEYLRVLQQFPEAGELSVNAVAQLLQCQMRQGDDLMAKTTANYLAERFGKKFPMAAKGVLAAGQLYRTEKAGQEGAQEMSDYLFETYLKHCPNDDSAGQILFYLANLAEKAGDEERANGYLAKILTEHPTDKHYPLALSKQAWKSYKGKDYAGAVKGMAAYLKETAGQANALRAQAMFALADCLRRTDRYEQAVKYFNELVKGLTENIRAYGTSPADVQKNTELLEQARFWMAFTLSQMEGNDAYRKMAVKKFDEFLEAYPQSAMAPKALKVKGSAQMALKDPGANETYARLAREYPNTDEGKNAQYARISGALELKQYDQAKEALRAMVSSAGSYQPSEFLRVGNELLNSELWAEAAAAYQQVLDKAGKSAGAEERALLERSYFGLGKAKYHQKDYAGSVAALNELMTKWPKSSLFYDAKFILAEANLAQGDTMAAEDALNSILRYVGTGEVLNDACLLMAKVQLKGGDKDGAASTYQRMEYLNSLTMKSERERAQIKEALTAALALEKDMDDNVRMLETCDAYLRLFPLDDKVPGIRKLRQSAQLKVGADANAAGAEEESSAEDDYGDEDEEDA